MPLEQREAHWMIWAGGEAADRQCGPHIGGREPDRKEDRDAFVQPGWTLRLRMAAVSPRRGDA